MALAVLGRDLAIRLGAPFIQMLLCAPSFSFPFVSIPRTYESSKEFVVPRHPRPTYQLNVILRRPHPPCLFYRCARLLSRTRYPWPAVPPTQRRLQALVLPNSTVAVGLLGWYTRGLPSSLQVPGLSWRACRDESMDETASVHGGGTKVLSRRSARVIDAAQARARTRIVPTSRSPSLLPHGPPVRHITLYDTSDGTHSRTLVPVVDVEGDWDGTSIEEAGGEDVYEEKAHGALRMRVWMRTSSPCARGPSPSLSPSAGAVAAVILKNGRLRLGAVDGYVRWAHTRVWDVGTGQMCVCGVCRVLRVFLVLQAVVAPPNTSECLPMGILILLRRVGGLGVRAQANASSLPASLRPPSHWSRLPRDRARLTVASSRCSTQTCATSVWILRWGCGWIKLRAHYAFSYLGGHTALGADAHSRALLEAKMEAENARGGTRMRLTPTMCGTDVPTFTDPHLRTAHPSQCWSTLIGIGQHWSSIPTKAKPAHLGRSSPTVVGVGWNGWTGINHVRF
ncbi:hypothetical protein B0H13DRAFT_2360795 [Mycena leptocephala]|nr:hypothetical protein B0H13DRAFT_2360795 [Mycena leptocephala]